MRVARTPLTAFAGLAAVVVLLSALSGCGGASSASEPAPTPSPGGTYVLPLEIGARRLRSSPCLRLRER